MSFMFISTRIKIKYNYKYNIIHINIEFVQKCKKFLSRHVVGGASKL